MNPKIITLVCVLIVFGVGFRKEFAGLIKITKEKLGKKKDE